jgi:hypothetical protein
LIMLLAIFGRVSARPLLIAFVVVVALDLIWIDQSLIEGRGKEQWLGPYRPLANYLKQAGATRVYSPSYSLPQQAAAYWDIPQFDGVDPFQMQTYVQAAEQATGVQAEGYSITVPAYRDDDPAALKTASELLATANRDARLRPDLLGQWLVSHVVSAYEMQADGLALDTRIGDVYIYRNIVVPDVELIWQGPNRVTIRTAQPVSGPLYAVARGRWKDQPDHPDTGLPGMTNGTIRQWNYTYDPAEVWISGLVGTGLMTLAAGVWWWERRGRE